jgi:hypothetical protein
MQNQTLKALSILTNHTVRHLLMGGQACVLYGAVQFSRDADIAVLATAENLDRFRNALAELKATIIAVPPLEAKYLDLGLAVHLRCGDPKFNNLRIDVMSKLRGVDSFRQLWNRRTTLKLPDGNVDVLNIADLVKAKKTQRDKDWPMIRALIEAHHAQNRNQATSEMAAFWLRESRTPEMLVEVARQYPTELNSALKDRPLLEFAISSSIEPLRHALMEEQSQEQQRDRLYWQPLIAELEKLRHNRPRTG